jgi:hypothetical protein
MTIEASFKATIGRILEKFLSDYNKGGVLDLSEKEFSPSLDPFNEMDWRSFL